MSCNLRRLGKLGGVLALSKSERAQNLHVGNEFLLNFGNKVLLNNLQSF